MRREPVQIVNFEMTELGAFLHKFPEKHEKGMLKDAQGFNNDWHMDVFLGARVHICAHARRSGVSLFSFFPRSTANLELTDSTGSRAHRSLIPQQRHWAQMSLGIQTQVLVTVKPNFNQQTHPLTLHLLTFYTFIPHVATLGQLY